MTFFQKGFSLVEMLIVIVCIALLTSITISSVHFLKHTQLKSEVKKLKSICLYLQHRAQVTNMVHRLQFDITQQCYFYNETKETLPRTIFFGAPSHLKGPPSSPYHAINKPITFKNNIIEFHPDGVISSGTVYVKAGEFVYALSSAVSQISYLRTYYYDKTWKLIS